MPQPIVHLAALIVKRMQHTSDFDAARESSEPFNAIIDRARQLGMHDIEEGSDDHTELAYAIEDLLNPDA
jgi:hypothetical protein